MRQNMTILRIYNHEYQCSSKLLVNAVVYNVDAQEKILAVKYLNQGSSITLLDAIKLIINSKLKDGSLNCLDTCQDFTLVKSQKRKGKQLHKSASKTFLLLTKLKIC